MSQLAPPWGSLALPYPIADVMPLGDSLTFGGIFDGGWRKTFFTTRTDLSSAGSLTFPSQVDRWVRHEGHSGYETAVILSADYLPRWLDGNPARNYIVHLGSADVFKGFTNPATYAANMTSIVQAVLARRPTAKILVAKIILWQSGFTTQNDAIVAMRAALVTAMGAFPGVTMVDMPVIANENYIDALHVDATGYAAMGAAFLSAATAAGI